MELDIEMFKEKILISKFLGNQRKCAIAMDITPEFLNRILRKNRSAGSKFFGKLKLYCDNNGLIFEEFIFFKSTINKS